MSTEFPAAFLQRISQYPEPVQEALKSPLDATSLRAYMRVLHGPDTLSPAEIDKILATPPVTDAFLGRQLVSRGFIKRLANLPVLLAQATPDDIAAVVDEVIAPLADPEAPFLYKLQEITSGGAALSEEMTLLMELVNFYTRAHGYDGDAEALVLADMDKAGQGRPVPLLPCLLAALDGAPVFRNAPLPAGLTLAAGTTFVRAVLDKHAPPVLSALSQDTLAFIRRDLSRTDSTVDLHKARPIRVVLEGSEDTAIPAFWTGMKEAGLVETVLHRATLLEQAETAPMASLYLPADSEVSPLLLAYLRAAGEAGVSLDLRVVRDQTRLSWSRMIEGYGDETTTAPYGRYQSGPDAPETALPLEIARVADVTRPGMLPEPAEADCYAIAVLLDDTTRPERFLNADRCILVPGLEALKTRFADAPPAVRQKPVLLLGKHTPKQPGYLVNAAQSFWAFGGHYPVTPAQVSYDSDAMRLRAQAATGESLGRLTLADLCALPLDQALALDPEELARTRLVFLPDGLIVQTPGNLPLEPEAVVALNRVLNGFELEPDTCEALFMGGVVTPGSLIEQSPVLHWPIAHLIRQPGRRQARLEGLLRRFAGHPDTTTANGILGMIGRQAQTSRNAAALDAFALQLSQHPEIVAGLDDPALETLIDLARRTASADGIAANLSISARVICQKNPGHIIPLFELLACTLEEPALNAALVYAAADSSLRARAMFRVGECLRRYASNGILLQHLVYLKGTNSKLLQDPGFLQFFQRVLSSDRPAALEALLGSDVLALIASTQDFREMFQRALLEGDRERLLDLLSDPEHARHVDFSKWMDVLRAFSNELRDLALPIGRSALSQTSSLHANRMMGVIFSDRKVLGELAEGGHLQDNSDLSITACNILGDNAPLNTMLAGRCAEAGITPLEIHGETAAEVFANAAHASATVSRVEGPRVSVIMSAFNADPALLELSLSSVLSQSHADIEVFVVDDASQQDNSAAIRAICDAQEQVFYSRLDVNSGPYIGRNLALEAATGDFIAIQDADDWSHPDRFATQVAALTENPLLQVVTCPHIRIDRAGKVQLEGDFTILGDGPMTSMFRRSVFDTVGPFAQIRSRGDIEMRERIRGYFGSHALTELTPPMMLCLADSATLSQRTKQTNYERLQLFRGNISSRQHLQATRRAGIRPSETPGILVPRALRPVTDVEG